MQSYNSLLYNNNNNNNSRISIPPSVVTSEAVEHRNMYIIIMIFTLSSKDPEG